MLVLHTVSSNHTGNTNDLGSFPGARRPVLHAQALTGSARREDLGLPARWRIRLCGDQFNLALGSIGLAIEIGATVSASLAGSTAGRRGRPTAFVGLNPAGSAR